jgi:hypothetical protein
VHRRVRRPRVDLRVLGREQHEARQLQRVGMRREHRQRRPVGTLAQLDLHAVHAPQHEALAGQRHLVPAPAAGQLVQAPVVLLRIGAHAQIPSRSLDQAHGVVTAPAQPVLDLDRRQRRLARVAPVDVARAAVHQPGLQQRQEQPLRPAVHDRIGAHERALPVKGEAQALQLAGHVLGAARHPLARRHAAGDRAELRRQAEGVEAEREQHAIPARAPEARVGVADRVAAHVADVHVARRERRRGLDVEVRLVVEHGGRARGAALAPGRLPTRLDGVCVIADVRPRAHVRRGYPRASVTTRRCYAQIHLAEVRDNTLTAPRRHHFGPAPSGVFSSGPTARIQRWR